jgi:hypothetical protein
MASTSNHYGDIKNWIERVIDSCTNYDQEIVAEKLISLYDDRLYNNDEIKTGLRYDTIRELRLRLNDRTFNRLMKELNHEN